MSVFYVDSYIRVGPKQDNKGEFIERVGPFKTKVSAKKHVDDLAWGADLVIYEVVPGMNSKENHDEEKDVVILKAVMGRWDIRYKLIPMDDDPQKERFEKSSIKNLLMAVRKKHPKNFDDLKMMIEKADSSIRAIELINNYEKEREYQKKMEKIK